MLNVSIVLYHPDWTQVQRLCLELLRAQCVKRIYLIDNSEHITIPEEARDANKGTTLWESRKISYQWNQGNNLGYGRAHNIAIRHSIYNRTAFHLVINADVYIQAADLDYLYDVIMKDDQIGSLMPRVTYPNGELQYLCKLLPSPMDVFARRFLPNCLYRRRNDRYELRYTGYTQRMNVPYLSGCFMLLRTKAVLQARLFDERYFMYPEDIDLTRTIHRNWKTMYIPDVTIIHDHARASYHSLRMTGIHMVNMCRYFHKWGWLFDPERRRFNRSTLQEIGQQVKSRKSKVKR